MNAKAAAILSMFQTSYHEHAGPQYDVNGMATALSDAADMINNLTATSKALLAEINVPEGNCSCHLAPPCGDCTENGSLREAVSHMQAELANVQAKLKVEVKV